eukprot:jgi/Mesvir1/11775/Mv00142-RA.1
MEASHLPFFSSPTKGRVMDSFRATKPGVLGKRSGLPYKLCQEKKAPKVPRREDNQVDCLPTPIRRLRREGSALDQTAASLSSVMSSINIHRSTSCPSLGPPDREKGNAAVQLDVDRDGGATQPVQTEVPGAQPSLRAITDGPFNMARMAGATRAKPVDVSHAVSCILSAPALPPTCKPGAHVAAAPPPAVTSVSARDRQVPFDECPPVDWSLKTNVVFTSPQPLDWVLSSKPDEETRELVAFVEQACSGRCTLHPPRSQGTCGSSGGGLAGADAAVTGASKHDGGFRQGLHSWVHPSAPVPEAVLTAISSLPESASSSYLEPRQRAWQDAFQSLFEMLGARRCPAFYYVSPQFTVLFRGPCALPRKNKFCAIMSRSTSGLRSLLTDDEVRFTMPLSTSEPLDEAAKALREEHLQELREMEAAGQAYGTSTSGRREGSTAESALFFNSYKRLNALFNFLISYRHTAGGASTSDVPTLLAPCPFVNATLKSLQPHYSRTRHISHHKLGRVTEDVGAPSLLASSGPAEGPLADRTNGQRRGGGGADAIEECVIHRLELQGMIPPWCLARIVAALHARQGGNFQASYVTEPLSQILNMDVGMLSATQSSTNSCSTLGTQSLSSRGWAPACAAEGDGPCMAMSWLGTSNVGNGAVKNLTCQNGLFFAALVKSM